MIGVVMALSVGAMSESLRAALDEWGETALGGDFYVHSYSAMRADIGRVLATVEGVEAVTPITIRPVNAAGATNSEGFKPQRRQVLLRALDPATYRAVTFLRFAEDKEQAEQIFAQFAQGGTVLLTPSLKQAFGVQRGDTIRLRTARGEQDFLVAGIVVDMYAGGQVAVFSRDDLREYFRDTTASYFAVKLADGASSAEVQARLEEAGKPHQLTILPTEVFRRQMREQYENLISLMNVIVVIVVFMSALGVMNTMTISVLERVREFGMLRGVGMTVAQVAQMVLGEAAAIGFVGAVFGLTAGVLVSVMMVVGMSQSAGWQMRYIFPTVAFVLGLGVSLIVSHLAALYAAAKAARLNIVDATRHEPLSI
jgi:putative ABC transport system permease protein